MSKRKHRATGKPRGRPRLSDAERAVRKCNDAAFQSEYWRANKAALIAKRRLRRLSLTESEREQEREKARERDKRKRTKITELLNAARSLVATLDAVENLPAPDTSEDDENKPINIGLAT